MRWRGRCSVRRARHARAGAAGRAPRGHAGRRTCRARSGRCCTSSGTAWRWRRTSTQRRPANARRLVEQLRLLQPLPGARSALRRELRTARRSLLRRRDGPHRRPRPRRGRRLRAGDRICRRACRCCSTPRWRTSCSAASGSRASRPAWPCCTWRRRVDLLCALGRGREGRRAGSARCRRRLPQRRPARAPPPAPPTAAGAAVESDDGLDWFSVLKATQAIAGEVEAQALLDAADADRRRERRCRTRCAGAGRRAAARPCMPATPPAERAGDRRTASRWNDSDRVPVRHRQHRAPHRRKRGADRTRMSTSCTAPTRTSPRHRPRSVACVPVSQARAGRSACCTWSTAASARCSRRAGCARCASW